MSKLEVKVPDIGDFKGVPVIEILVKPGDSIKAEDPLIVLESDKATMEVPAPEGGVVSDLLVKVGDKVSEGAPILTLVAEGASVPAAAPAAPAPAPEPAPAPVPAPAPAAGKLFSAVPILGLRAPLAGFGDVFASPAVRRLARELDIDLTRVPATGDKGRLTKEDVKAFLAGGKAAPVAPAGAGIPEIPAIDFSKFGPVEEKPLSRIRKLSGPFLHRSWLNVPAVTHNDEADITDLEDFRKRLDDEGKKAKEPYRVSLLPFLIRACVAVLKQYPDVNSSLSPSKDSLIHKKYWHIGFACDTPEGLVVPVIRDADKKGVLELALELGELSAKARAGKLTPAEMSGATFTISSLGGIGGTSFSPIVNAPEVAILGVVRAKMAPVWTGKEFLPRLMLPLSLSYDHRVIDGAAAARFARALCAVLEDIRRLSL
jgi:pyruvate dehydrogenase E2 component (dihydrolipoyllysine-residue acetyltransferase)